MLSSEPMQEKININISMVQHGVSIYKETRYPPKPKETRDVKFVFPSVTNFNDRFVPSD